MKKVFSGEPNSDFAGNNHRKNNSSLCRVKEILQIFSIWCIGTFCGQLSLNK